MPEIRSSPTTATAVARGELADSDSGNSASQTYQDEIARIDRQISDVDAIDRRFAGFRLGLFVAFIASLGFSLTTGHSWWVVLTIVSLLTFLVVVVWNEGYRDRLQMLRAHSRTLRRLQDRVDRKWSALAEDRLGRDAAALTLTDRQAALAGDLDLTGNSSLFQLVSMAGTQPGMRTLLNWLCDPADVETSRQRHQLAQHLATLRDDRIRFHTLARDVGGSTAAPEAFVQWAQSA
ncbi:MAG: DNA mismatch repair protein, partial [Planctomycetota bacterium]